MPDKDGGGIEVSGPAYARLAITNDATNFPAADDGEKANAPDWNFGVAGGSWGTFVGCCLLTSEGQINGTYVENSGAAGLAAKKITRALWCQGRQGFNFECSLRTQMSFPSIATGSQGYSAAFCLNQNSYITGSVNIGGVHPPISLLPQLRCGQRGVAGEALISWPPTAGGTGEVLRVLWDALLINRAFSVDVEPSETYDGKKWHNYTSNCSSGALFLVIPLRCTPPNPSGLRRPSKAS